MIKYRDQLYSLQFEVTRLNSVQKMQKKIIKGNISTLFLDMLLRP